MKSTIQNSIAIVILLALFSTINLHAANRYWVGGDGAFSQTAHWSGTSGGVSGSSVPASGDIVYFDQNSGGTFTVTLGANYTVKQIIVSQPSGTTAVTIDDGGNGWTLSTSTAFTGSGIQITGGTLTLGSGGGSAIVLSVGKGNLSISTGAGFTINAGSGGLDAGTNNKTITNNGTLNITYGSLTCAAYTANSGSITTIASTANAPAIDATGNVGFYGTLSNSLAGLAVNSGGTLYVNATLDVNQTNFSDSYSATNVDLSPTSTIRYNGSGSQNINAGVTYGNLQIYGGGTKSIQGYTVISGNLSVGSNDATLFSNSANYNMSIGGDLTINVTATPVFGTGTYTFNGSTPTLIFTNLNAAATIGSISFDGSPTIINNDNANGLTFTSTSFTNSSANISISGTGSVTFTNSGGLSLTGSFAALNVSSGSFTHTGPLTMSGSNAQFNITGGNVTITGNTLLAGTISLGGSGTKTFSGSVNAFGSTTISGGTVNANNGTPSNTFMSLTVSNGTANIGNGTSGNQNISSDLTMTGGSVILKGSNTTNIITGNVSVAAGSTLTIDNSTTVQGPNVNIAGTLNLGPANGGPTFTHDNSTVSSSFSITGTVNGDRTSATTVSIAGQTVTLSGTTQTFDNLIISNSSGTAAAGANVSVDGNLSLSKDFEIGSNILTFNSNAPNNPFGTTTGEVIGKVSRTLTGGNTFRFNAANTYITLPSIASNTFIMKLVKSNPDAQALQRYYDLTSSSPINNPDGSYGIQMQYKVGELNSNNETILKLWYGACGAGENQFTRLTNSTVNTSTKTISYSYESNLPDAFNKCLALGASDQPLPVELKSFTAKINGKQIDLRWMTATEINNYGFDIQRKNTNGEFERIGFVNGNGTKNTSSSYFFNDLAPLSGKNIYRLKQIDRDGTTHFSQVVELTFVTGIGLQQNYPNPFNPSTTIQFSVPQSGNATLKVFDLVGKEVATLFNQYTEKGIVHTIDFDANAIPSGTYIYALQAGTYTETKRMTIVK